MRNCKEYHSWDADWVLKLKTKIHLTFSTKCTTLIILLAQSKALQPKDKQKNYHEKPSKTELRKIISPAKNMSEQEPDKHGSISYRP